MLQVEAEEHIPNEESRAEALQVTVDELKSQEEEKSGLAQVDAQRVVSEAALLSEEANNILQQVSSEIERRNKLLDMACDAAMLKETGNIMEA